MGGAVPVSALLPERLDSVAEQVRGRLCEDEQVRGMKLAWDYVGKELHGALASVLDCDLVDLLGKAWAEVAELAEFADPARHPPGERSVCALGEHDVAHELNPVVAVTIGSCPCVEIAFVLAVRAHVGGVRLTVADGHILGGDLGELWASAELSLEGVPLHPPAESRKVRVPGEFAFAAPGIPIPRLH